ncbi:MAG: class I SAM-dependent methyltransferase [Dactylosporangium sp.]|nr:class I SAM-dependent methyltransferase [Dactylosporangium sp.]NNJ60244.1 class I SAM-dependent methyltransferase [Dactylosporangium sp.]
MDSTGWDQRYAATPDLVWAAEPNQFVAEIFRGRAPGRALDLAAGEGRNATWLAGQGWRATAVDFSATGLDKGRRLAREQGVSVHWVVADLRTYRPEPQGFDAVLVAYLHVPTDERAGILARAAGAVAPGGTLLVVGHALANLTAGVGGPQDPAVLYTPETIAGELPGLVVRRAEVARRRVTVADGSADALDVVVVAVRGRRS